MMANFIFLFYTNASYEHIFYIISRFTADALLLYKVKLERFVNECV